MQMWMYIQPCKDCRATHAAAHGDECTGQEDVPRYLRLLTSKELRATLMRLEAAPYTSAVRDAIAEIHDILDRRQEILLSLAESTWFDTV